MGVLSTIISLLKAIPSLERLVLKIADGLKEQKAKARRDEKLERIDSSIDDVLRGLRDNEEVQFGGSTNEPPSVSSSSQERPRLD